MAAETETGFLIDGTIYEVPPLDSLDGDECLVFFDYCGLVQEDFAPLADETEEETDDRNQKQMRHPGFWLGLMHIAYRRKHRELKDAKVKALIGKTNRLEALSVLGAEETEDPEVPLGSTSEPDESSPRSSPVNESSSEPLPVSSGLDSTTDSDRQDATLAPTTASR